MLCDELAGRPYNKADHNRALQAHTGRNRSSIEFKHRNISAVLVKLGMPWIIGYKPLANFQNALIEGIGRFLAQRDEPISMPQATTFNTAENATLFIEAAPKLPPRPEIEAAALKHLVRKFDPAARDERNRALGKCGEEHVLRFEKERLRSAGCESLADKVRWVSNEDGDGAGFDILSFTTIGEERFLEVKTTRGYSQTPFYLSANEHALSVERPDKFRIFRVYDFARAPKAFKLVPPLNEAVRLETAIYRASFG